MNLRPGHLAFELYKIQYKSLSPATNLGIKSMKTTIKMVYPSTVSYVPHFYWLQFWTCSSSETKEEEILRE